MKKLVLLLCLQSVFVFGQAPIIQWQKSLGGSGTDALSSIQKTTDGGYIVAGYSYSTDGNVTGNHGGQDYWVVKLDANRNITWQKSYGGTGNDRANSIQQTIDGGYIVAGESNSTDGDVTGNHGNYDVWVVKLDAFGEITWQKSYGGTGSDRANSIQQTTDGGYIVAGTNQSTNGDVTGNHGGIGISDYWIVKLNATGNITWQKSLGGEISEEGRCIQQTTDGGYIVAGNSSSNNGNVTGNHGGTDYWIVKLNSAGNITWQKTLGGTESENVYSIQQTTDGGYIIAGCSKSNDGDVTGNHGGWDYWIVKLNATGSITWQKSLGGSGNDGGLVSPCDIQQTIDGGYIFTGSPSSIDGDVTGNPGNGRDYWVVKLNSTGNITWQKSYGGTGNELVKVIQQTTGGGYIVAGNSSSNNGNVTGNHGGDDYWIVKLGDCSPVSNTITETACESFTWTAGDGNTYTSSTTAAHTIVGGAANGCDSIVTLNLTINQPTMHTITETACESYTLNAQTYTSSGTYTQTLTNANNCDSTITLNLTINQPSTHTITATACESYTLNSQTYTSSGTYTQMLTNANNCDSTITLNLTINQPTTSVLNEIACESYTLNSQTYTLSGTYTQTLTNANNCDSTITLNLTINQPTTHTITETACESYTLNSQTYTVSGTYTQTLTNANNCDSTITLNLTINQPTTHIITATACESYTLNTQTYTSSGTYTQTLTNADNCDSTITLNLTINNVDATVSLSGITLTANQTGATYQWIDCDNGNTPISGETTQSFEPTSNGNYAVEVIANGCMKTSDCIVVNSVGIDKKITDVFQVFPNPGNGIFFISSEKYLENATIDVYDYNGKRVYHSNGNSGQLLTIDLHNQPDGVYIGKINDLVRFKVVLSK